MDFGRERGYGGPYLAAPPTSARVQNRVEFLSLLVMCHLLARGKFKPELEFHDGSSFHAVVPARIIPRTM